MPSYNRNVKQDAREVLLSQYRDKPRIQALVDALADESQTLEDEVHDLKVSSILASASGSFLDRWGAVVGERRGPFNDFQYRNIIEAKILAGRSNATLDELIEVYRTVTNAEEIRAFGKYPAAVKLQARINFDVTPEYSRRVVRIMDIARAAGVGLTLVYYTSPTPFQWDVTGYDVGGYAGIFV